MHFHSLFFGIYSYIHSVISFRISVSWWSYAQHLLYSTTQYLNLADFCLYLTVLQKLLIDNKAL